MNLTQIRAYLDRIVASYENVPRGQISVNEFLAFDVRHPRGRLSRHVNHLRDLKVLAVSLTQKLLS